MNDLEWAPPRAVVTEQWLEDELRPERAGWVADEERALFDRLAGGSGQPIVLFGAGNLGRMVLAGLRGLGQEPVAFIDNSASLDGTLVDGIPVYRPEDAAIRFGDRVVTVVTIWTPRGRLAYPDVSKQMRELGVTRVLPFAPLFWKHPDVFLPYFSLDAPHRLYADATKVKSAFGLFINDHSKNEYLTQLTYLLSAMDSIDVSIPPDMEWYFPSDIMELSAGEVFVDCGAYDGDTIDSFLRATGGRCREIAAFEPDPSAADRLRTYVSGLPVDVREHTVVHQKAVGSVPGVLHFEGGGTPGSRVVSSGTLEVECVVLDSILDGIKPTFIKMDIEGAEEDALRGASRLIERDRPILAICVYHLQSHFYTLPTLISELCPDYHYFFRRQGSDSDLVCFAIPNERMPEGLAEQQ